MAELTRAGDDGAFARDLAELVSAKLHLAEEDNLDTDRFLRQEEQEHREVRFCQATVSDLLQNTPAYSAVYDSFADRTSRRWFIHLVAYRLLGRRHVRLPTNCPEHWETRAKVKAMAAKPFTGLFGPLSEFEVDFSGERLSMEAWWSNIAWTFFFRQYYLSRHGASVSAQPGDRVIDAGACFGDTALGFAAAVGAKGRVVSLEIDPANVAVARRNVERNPAVAARIALKECALAHAVVPLYLHGAGPGARVGSDPSGRQLEVTTIDRMVEAGELDRVDFIKMDIEGAERASLAGAEQSIRRFRPRLAISIYHQPSDLWFIARWIASLDLGYRLHLEHYTIHHEETVLYAVA
jgi:FkbM family methyltransferase